MKLRNLACSLALLAGCGADDQSPTIRIGFASRELLSGVQVVRIVFHPADRRCEQLRAMPAVAALRGTVRSEDIILDDDDRELGSGVDIEMIPAGTYTAVAVGAAAAGPSFDVIAFGCVEDQVISDGERTDIEIVLGAL